jgi:hypothetical protein
MTTDPLQSRGDHKHLLLCFTPRAEVPKLWVVPRGTKVLYTEHIYFERNMGAR